MLLNVKEYIIIPKISAKNTKKRNSPLLNTIILRNNSIPEISKKIISCIITIKSGKLKFFLILLKISKIRPINNPR